MNRKYNEIMDKVEVSEEMRNRILVNIKKRKKVIRIKKITGYIGVAACMVLMLTAAVIIPKIDKNSENVQVVNGIEECSSAEELSSRLGFEISDIDNIPFVCEKIIYENYWGNMAQITYEGRDNCIIYRKSEGNGDISGDYNIYSEEKIIDMAGYEVNVKGDNGVYKLAIWETDRYSYSISVENGADAGTIEEMIDSVN